MISSTKSTVDIFANPRRSVLQTRMLRMAPKPTPTRWRGKEAFEMDSEAVQITKMP